jgi:hypothetical protein
MHGNKEFIECAKKAFAASTYNDGEWKESEKEESGIVFDSSPDACISEIIPIVTILEVLANNKDASSDVEYDVEGLGKFKISPVKDGYTVTCTFNKEFKSTCKSDALAEKFINMAD